jgi:enoyl-CoA hydratase/carnithine racemase
MLHSEDSERVRVLTLDRPEALNAFNEELYDALTEALLAALADPSVAVVVLTGAGRAFCAGTDLLEMAQRATDPNFVPGRHGFIGLIDTLIEFDKPLLLAVNGLGLGIGATIIGLSDLVFMSSAARLRCPFTDLAVAPEAASSYTFPALLGRQRAAWVLLSSEWLSADECRDLGLVFRVCTPEELLETTMTHARKLAAKPISSLRATKRLMTAHHRDAIAAARAGENAAFQELMAGPANAEALAAFAEKRAPDFTNLPPGW